MAFIESEDLLSSNIWMLDIWAPMSCKALFENSLVLALKVWLEV
ncbi:hypothetical protein [Bathymodiolus thermophilus thioautotrophic gill symbiont]|nr:hypothetical protein [Bathymodiolus thermophilus thioautotrophic gill symbiont]